MNQELNNPSPEKDEECLTSDFDTAKLTAYFEAQGELITE